MIRITRSSADACAIEDTEHLGGKVDRLLRSLPVTLVLRDYSASICRNCHLRHKSYVARYLSCSFGAKHCF